MKTKNFILIIIVILLIVSPRPMKANEVSSNQTNKKFFLSLKYQAGFLEESEQVSLVRSAYLENATYTLSYSQKKGGIFDAIIGLNLGPTWGILLGGSTTSRDVNETTGYSIPHPLWFGNPRSGTNSGTGLSLNETDIYLNAFYKIRFGSFAIDLYGGPCVILAKASIIADFNFSESSYPYLQVIFSQSSSEFTNTVFGFDLGLSFGYSFSSDIMVLLEAKYLSGKTAFKPANDIPEISVSLGGFRLGGGIKFSF